MPDVEFDLVEASRSFAVARYTATVFHLMRAVETVVQRLAEPLNIAKVEREWGKLLSDLHARIGHMPAGPVRTAWSEAHANLYHLKTVWRNPTMHPKRTYTEEEAAEIMAAARTFLRQIATLVARTD